MILPVILCGGSGTRLWPLSRQSLPKQFVPLIGGKSLLELTLERVAHTQLQSAQAGSRAQVICVASEEHRFFVEQSMQAAQTTGSVLLEPIGRNTAAAMALAALWQVRQGSETDLLLFCPADHHIPDVQAFSNTMQLGVEAANQGAIVTYGVMPSFPSTAYGYIQHDLSAVCGSAHRVQCFIEKPNASKAAQLLLQGDVLWNAGIFLCQAGILLQALKLHAADILETCRHSMQHCKEDGCFIRPDDEIFKQCRSQSIDYAVMEHHNPVMVVPFKGQWSDVGSWNAVAELTPADSQGNRIHGKAWVVDGHHNFVHAEHRPVVALGTENLLIIDTPDALLVASNQHAERVKDVVAMLHNQKIPQASMHRRVARPWGWYDSIDLGARFQVKRIGVKPGASLSLQKHHHRAEHWVVVKGTGKITRGQEVFLLTENQSTYIPVGEIHRLENPGVTELEIIEIQSGSYLGEDDIVRLEDVYGRNKA
jgi:mannose-1-phosphate guanylyltransferase/mannose-6-phosphate isomerase